MSKLLHAQNITLWDVAFKFEFYSIKVYLNIILLHFFRIGSKSGRMQTIQITKDLCQKRKANMRKSEWRKLYLISMSIVIFYHLTKKIKHIFNLILGTFFGNSVFLDFSFFLFLCRFLFRFSIFLTSLFLSFYLIFSLSFFSFFSLFISSFLSYLISWITSFL